MKKTKIALILNIINVCFVLFAFIAMVTGFHFMSDYVLLQISSLKSFIFFTIDSNVFVGIVSVACAIYQFLIIKGKKEDMPKLLYLLKLVSTVSVSVTLFTVLFFLAPLAEDGYHTMFLNSNLFFHLLIPLIAIIGFIFFEGTTVIIFKETFYGLLPTVIYGIFYSINIFVHMENGVIDKTYDWYGFAQYGTIGIVISMIVMSLFTYIISLGLFYANKKLQMKSKEEK